MRRLEFLFLWLLKCFTSPGSHHGLRRSSYGLRNWVSPFGNLRIIGCYAPPRSVSPLRCVLHRLSVSRHPPFALMTSLHKFRDIAKFQNRSGFQARRRDRSHCYLKEEQRRSRPILELMLVTLFCPTSLLCFDGLSILSQSKDSSLTYRRGYASLLAPRIRGKIAVIASRAICAGRSSPTIPMLTLIAMPQMYWHIVTRKPATANA